MPDPHETLQVEASGTHLVVRGELDAHTATVLAPHLDPLPGASGDITLDLSALDFVDSSGLRLIVAAHQQAAEAGRRLVLTSPSKAVIRLLEVAGLGDHLHVAASDDA
jgi:anti-sigma B factor antagonist